MLMATGCAGSAESPSAERLTIALPAAVGGPLNPFVTFTEQVSELVYDKLLAPSPYVDDPQPWLASQVTMVDPTTWEVTLRDDVTWHDGEKLTAGDVAFTFHYAHAAPTGRFTHHVNEIPDISSVEVLAADKVRFTCAFACPELGPVTLADLPILPEHIWSTVPPGEVKNYAALPVGTGPYRLVAFDQTTGYRFEANPDYFAGAPVVRELVMPIIADPSATFTALQAGEIDAAFRPVSPELIEQFSASTDVSVVETRPLRFPELRLNFERAPFDEPRFRKVLSLALDRRELLDTVFLGQGRVADKGYPHPDSPWTDPTLSTPSDPAGAKAVLDELGFTDRDGDGVRESPAGPLRFTISAAGSEPTQVRAAEIVAEQLTEVGIAATVQGLDAGTFADLATSRNFDIFVNTITAHGVADPTQSIMSHRSGYLWDAPDLPYPAWDTLFERWKATTTIEDRREVAFEMQRMFNEQPTSIPLYYPDEHWAFRPASFAGWVESPGFGIVHKWSLLPRTVSETAGAIVTN
ncbi:MAG: ABC transporter substrate-binding protein [Pseudonocardia sp.]|nr:ABC transporter substrate-binding protein [Pseudonocardia sp.]